MSQRTFRSSVDEIRYFQRHTELTLDGSTPISEFPNLDYLNLKNNIMFCIEINDGVYYAVSGPPTTDFRNINWWPHYLPAEQFRAKECGGTVVGSDIIIGRMADKIDELEGTLGYANKRIRQLLTETMEQQKRLNPELEDYHHDNFNHRTSPTEHAIEGAIEGHNDD